MRRAVRCTFILVGLLTAGLVVSGTPALAGALPSYRVWIADVAATIDKASRYIDYRLEEDEPDDPAIVLDVDNTALESTYNGGREAPATRPVLKLAEDAEYEGVAIFFITARPSSMKSLTKDNLEDVGYPVDGLYTRPSSHSGSVQKYKINSRIDIERHGYTIIANIGNMDHDLAGGHADRTFKLPDYNGNLS